MKVFLFFLLVFICIFSACNRDKSKSGDEALAENLVDSVALPDKIADGSFDYGKILKGDLSDFAGH